MEMIKNGVPTRLEFGDYGNFATLTPEAVSIERFGPTHLSAVITYNYGKDDSRVIDLCHDNLAEIDYESFGTSYESELDKIGYTPDQIRSYLNRFYVKDAE